LALAVIAACALPAAAALLSTSTTVPIPCIDSYGNPSWEVTGDGTGKLYKEEHTGILIGCFTGKILNKCGRSIVIKDQGYCFDDPWRNKTLKATTDLQVVSKPIHVWSRAVLVVCYNPLKALP
jgi:hypothetical protein